jgi:DNA-binding NarL/FixJ family response regulator
VVLAEDQPMVRAGFRALLDSRSEIEVVGEAATGGEALEAVRAHEPDVVVMDIRMPEMDGLEATRRITSDPALNRTRVLVLTTFELDEYVFGALDAGASGFLLKGGEPADLVQAIQIVATGDALLAPSVTRKLIREFARQAPASPRPPIDVLTDREQDVLALVARGLSNAEIATELFITLATVKTHVSRLLTKLAARDRAQLIVIAYESGFVTPA